MSQSLARVVEEFEKEDSKIDVLSGGCIFRDESGRALKTKREYFFSGSMLLYYGCFMPSCATFIRRTIIDNGIMLDENYMVTMDYEWYMRIYVSGYKIKVTPFTIASFVWHESNISSIYSERIKEERLKVQEKYSKLKGPRCYRYAIYELLKIEKVKVVRQ